MIINACHQAGLSSSPPMDYACARVALLEVQAPQERSPYRQPAEQPHPDRLPYHQAEQHGPLESCHMDYIDVHHQYKHHHHHHHNYHNQPQPLQHPHPRQLPVGGGYVDLGGSFISSEASPVSFDVLYHAEKEKQRLSQNQYVDQCGSASNQASYKPCEDGHISVKTYEDAHLLSKLCEDVHILPGRQENLHFVHDGRYSQHRFQSSSSTSAPMVPRIKLLCSIGGRIMGRPADGKLRYCGGDTRIINVDRGLCFTDLMGKLSQIYGSAVALKYQLPGEDLDALVSVSSDDDLQNMLDEYDKMVATGGSSWFRLFLFRIPSDCEIFTDFKFCHETGNCYSDIMQRYINAINGFDSKGGLERLTDVQLESNLNDHHLPLRLASDLPYTTLVGPCLTTKPSSRVPSAPSSVPSSPSVAAMQARHKQCGTGECLQFSKEQHGYVTPMSGLDQELSQDRHLDMVKCEHHQGHILGESPRMQQDPQSSRGDALWWVKEHGTQYADLEDTGVHQLERHRGTGTIVVDALHDVPKPFGLIDSQREAYCGNPLTGQPFTSLVHGGQVEDDFGRAELVQHCYVEGPKQVPILHQLHQTGSPLHWEGLTQLQRGPGIESTCQTADGQGHSPFSQEPMHIHLQHPNVMSSIPIKALSSTPSSPQNVYPGRCSCCQQHFQVDRGISVSLGEHSHSRKLSHFGDQPYRRHGLPLVSRFCEGSNFYSDSGAWPCLPNLKKGWEFDEQKHEACLRMHRLGRIKTRRRPPGESGANERAAHSFMEPVQGEGSLHHCRFCCADTRDTKGQHIDKARVFPSSPEFQAYMGECEIHPGFSEENVNVSTAGRLTHDQKAVFTVERGHDILMGLNLKNGQVDLETSMQDGPDASGFGHMHASNLSSILGHRESGFDVKSESFSSTDAVAGSLSRPSLEPPVWVVSPPLILHDAHSKEREAHLPIELIASTTQLVGGTRNQENTGDTYRSPSFDHMDPYTRVRSTCKTEDASELRVENSPVSSLIHLPEEKINISNAHGSQPKFDDFCSVSSSQPFTARTLELGSFKESATLALPTYDKSPISSVDNATFSFAQREEKSVSNGKEIPEQCVNSRSIHIAKPHQSNGQHLEIVKVDVDYTASHEQETMPVLEELKSLSRPSSRQCSVESGALDKGNAPSEVVPVAQSSMTNEVIVSGSLNVCTEEDEKELPATQAEAEAIARGLQIIKNDDLEDLKELGSGTYGTVFHGKWRGSDVAIKRIKASCFTGRPSEQDRLISDFWREAGTLSQLHHPNIVAFYGVVPDGPGGTLATVTEYMVNGSLKQVLVKKDRTIDRRKRLLIAMDAAFGMEYLHSKRIVHFDLKSENLLVNMRDAHRPICKVGDFGLSKVKHQTLVSGGVRGTLPWMAPELLSTKGLVTEKVDVYSFGIVMWELLTSEEPYANMHCGTIIGGIVNDNLRPPIPSWCDPSWRNLMERCWSGNPADRPDFTSVASELRAIASSMNVK